MVGVWFWLSGAAVLGTCFISTGGIWGHLRNYKKPDIQRSIIRILLMPMIYGITSWIAYGHHYTAIILDPIRDCYEAFVLWVFFQLMVQYLGGERALLLRLDDGRLPTIHPWPMDWVLRPVDFSVPQNFLSLKRGVLQFAFIKPVHATLVIVLRLVGVYEEGVIAADNGYIYIALLYNLSVMLSMYCLVLFYITTRVDSERYRPLAKFLCIKAVIFFSFWQQILISILVKVEVIKDSGSAASIQDWIICIEMLIAAVAHRYSFGFKEYEELDSARFSLPAAVRDAIGTQDLVMEVRHTLQGTNFLSQNDLLADGSTQRLLSPDSPNRYVSATPVVRFSDPEEDPANEDIYAEALEYPGGDYNYNVRV